MPRYFTHYWSEELCGLHVHDGRSGAFVEFTAGSGFTRKGVQPGDIMYLMSVFDGQFLLIGRMEVGSVTTSRKEVEKHVDYEVDVAEEYVLPMPGGATPLFFTRGIPWETVGELRFIGLDGSSKPLKLVGYDEVDEAMLVGVRELTASSAAMLDQVLAEEYDDASSGTARFDEEEEEIDERDLLDLENRFDDAERNIQSYEAAIGIAIKEYSKRGWTVKRNTDASLGYDLHCVLGKREVVLAVKGSIDDVLAFTMREIEYIRAERDDRFGVCVVTHALSKRPVLFNFFAEDLDELFDARPLRWAFRYRGFEEGYTEDF